MKTINFKPGTPLKEIRLLLIGFAALAIVQVAKGQAQITNVFTHMTNATTATSYSGTGATGNSPSGLTGNTYTYHFGSNVAATNNNQVLDSFTTIGLNYHFQPATFNVKFRRADNASVTGIRKGLWMQSTAPAISPGGTANLYADYDDSLERVFSRRLFNVGIDNLFQNATTTNNNNIERMDVIFPGGIRAIDNTKAGFAVFERGTPGGHDGFYIAAITSLDPSGNPLTYSSALLVGSSNYGNSVGGNITYLILRRNTGNPGLLLVDNNSASQNRDGVFVRFSDIGIANNINIFGYSLFNPDVDVTPASNMVNYLNATNFPTTTENGGLGGLDPAAVTGLWVTNASFIVLPEKVQSFTASLTTDKVKLSWQLGVVDNLKLTVERSPDGISYLPILNFSTPSPGLQTASDQNPVPGENYYRLQMLYGNGTISYSSVIMVKKSGNPSYGMNVYPNPVKNKQFNLYIQAEANKPYTFRIFGNDGRLILTKEISGGQSGIQVILPAGLTGGMYFARLAEKGGTVIATKMMLIE